MRASVCGVPDVVSRTGALLVFLTALTAAHIPTFAALAILKEHSGCLRHAKWAERPAARRQADPDVRRGVRGWHAGQLEPGPVRRLRGQPVAPAGPFPRR